MEIKNYLFEEWRPVVGYEGLYEVSNYGRVRSVDRVVFFKNGKRRFFTGMMISQEKTRNGYLRVQIKRKNFLIHRLVAFAFPDAMYKPWFDGATQINHRDENKEHNFVDVNDPRNSNLEWSTAAENSVYGTAKKRNAYARSHMIKITKIETGEVFYVKGYAEAERLGFGKKYTLRLYATKPESKMGPDRKLPIKVERIY